MQNTSDTARPDHTHRIAPVLVLASLYFLLFAALGAEVSFLPNVLATAGLTPGEVGAVLAVGTLAQILAAPAAGTIADRLGPRSVLFVAATTAAASLLLLSLSPGGVAFAMLVYVSFAMATAPLNPLADAICVPACQRMKLAYGRLRGAGSLGFLVGILLSSRMAGTLGATSTILTAAALFALLTAVLPFLPSPTQAGRRRAEGSIGRLLRIKAYRRVLLVAAMVVGSHAMSDAFAVIYWQANGIALETIGILLALAVVAELALFVTVGPLLIDRLGASACAAIGAVLAAIGWVALAELHMVWSAAFTQVLHGAAFSLVHLACMQAMAEIIPHRTFALAQSLYGICGNAVASAIVTLAAGILYGALHGHVFLLAAALCVAAVPLAFGWTSSDPSESGADLPAA